MTQALEHLRQEVREVASTVDSTIVFIDGIVERLREALLGGDTEADVESLADELEAAKVKLASAVAANTASENDSGDDTVDHGPIGDTSTAQDGSPAIDSSLGGEPQPEDEAPVVTGDESIEEQLGAGDDDSTAADESLQDEGDEA